MQIIFNVSTIRLRFTYFKIFVCFLAVLGLCCGMWYPVPWPGTEPGLPTLAAWSQPLDHQGRP